MAPGPPSPILVLGAGGLVGGAVVRLLDSRRVARVARTRAECDIASFESVARAVAESGAACAINCAAYNAVDRAESEPALALAVNRDGAGHVARAAPVIVHYSTDYVFDGEKDGPYVETDEPRPLSLYARSKSEGDAAVARENPRHYLLRVGCIFGRGGRNYGSTVLGRLLRGERVRADGERVVQPTWADAIAAQTLALIATGSYGLYHSMCHGATTWADYTRELCRLAGISPELVEAVSASAIPAAARRPRRAVLENRALARLGIDLMPHWSEALAGYLADVLPPIRSSRT